MVSSVPVVQLSCSIPPETAILFDGDHAGHAYSRTDITKDSQSMEKISLFLLSTVRFGDPPGFALFTITSTWFDRMLTYRYLLTYLLVL